MEMVTERIIRNPARRYTMNLTRLERELLYAALYRYVQARTGDVRHDEEDRQALVDMFHYIVDQLRGQKEPPLDINNKFLVWGHLWGRRAKGTQVGKSRKHKFTLVRLERELLYAALYEFTSLRMNDKKHPIQERDQLANKFNYLAGAMRPWDEPTLAHKNPFSKWDRPVE